VQWAVGNERERGHLLRQICGVGQLLLQVSLRLEQRVEEPLPLHVLANLLVRYFGHRVWGAQGWRLDGAVLASSARRGVASGRGIYNPKKKELRL
jgi:hypothetical protein